MVDRNRTLPALGMALVVTALAVAVAFLVRDPGSSASTELSGPDARTAADTAPVEQELADSASVPGAESNRSHALGEEAAEAALAAQAQIAEHDEGGARLRIHVVDCDTGEGLPDFTLRVRADSVRNPSQNVTVEATTDDLGFLETAAIFPRALLEFEHAAGGDVPRRLEPETYTLLAGEGETEELELCARSASLVVTLEAHGHNGVVLANAGVALIEGAPDEDGKLDWFHWRMGETDAQGQARIPLYGALAGREFCAQVREPRAGEVCDAVMIPSPIDQGPHLLHTYPGGALHVLAVDDRDQPLAATRVTCWYPERPRMKLESDLVSDAAGRVSFAPLPAGRYLVAVDGWATSPRSGAQEVALEMGEERDLVVHRAKAGLKDLLVAGHVFELDGTPARNVILGVLLDGHEHHLVFTDESGSFELHDSGEWEDVLVTSAATVFGTSIEPREVHVASGTTGLEFRKLEELQEQRMVFRLFDDLTGELIPDSVDPAIVLERKVSEGSRVLAVARFGPNDGVTFVDYHPHDDLVWRVLAPGYREAFGDLELPAPGEEAPIHDVRLTPGFRRELIARNTSNGERIANVSFATAAGEEFARSSSDGQVTLVGEIWPGVLSVSHPNFESLEWNANAHWSNVTAQLWMKPRE